MDALYYEYYDRIYSTKNYRQEAETAWKICQELAGHSPRRILDVGCGTGSHDMVFVQMGAEVVGIDLDCPAVAQACQKASQISGHRPVFYCQAVEQLPDQDFDLAVSLFNVINYLDTLSGIESFFKAIQQRLAAGGVYIFDCWNGLAAILDPPRVKHTRLEYEAETITIDTIPQVNWMEQQVSVENRVTITHPDGRESRFTYNYEQTLWTPKMLKSLLQKAGFASVTITTWMQPEQPAAHDTWKIMFICREAG